MDAMFERMNAIVAGNGPGLDKENTPPGGNVNPGNERHHETKKEEMPPLRKDCAPQDHRMLRVGSQCQQMVDRMEVGQGNGRGDQMTGTGDVE